VRVRWMGFGISGWTRKSRGITKVVRGRDPGGWLDGSRSPPHLAGPRGVSELSGYRLVRRLFDAPADWAGKTVRVEFEAVYHSATVWLNGKPIGQHLRRGYTAFTLDMAAALRPGASNTLVVKVDNTLTSRCSRAAGLMIGLWMVGSFGQYGSSSLPQPSLSESMWTHNPT